MIDFKQIFSEFKALECISSNEKTYNVISLPEMSHKLGISKEHFPMFFVSTSDSQDNVPNTIRELLSVEYDMECTVKESDGQMLLSNFAIITLRTNDEHLQSYFIEIFLMMLSKMSHQPSKQALSIEVERLVTIFSALTSAPRKKIQGLWAELLVIERCKNYDVLINAWHSSASSKYDFTLGQDKIEVKSTSSEERIHKFSLDQLNPSPSSRLLIASMTVRESGKCAQGLSVRNLYDRICESISNIDVKIRLYTIIAQTLGTDIDKIGNVFFDYVAAADTLAYYDYQAIPRILKTDVPANVSDVKFASNITKLEDINSASYSSKFSDSELFNCLF